MNASAPRKLTGGVGIMFLIVAVVNFLKGDDWVVWLIIGVLFGGLGFLKRVKAEGN